MPVRYQEKLDPESRAAFVASLSRKRAVEPPVVTPEEPEVDDQPEPRPVEEPGPKAKAPRRK